MTDDDVGLDAISGRPKIAKAVLDEMRQYLSVVDPQEKMTRAVRVRKSVWDLENDPIGQKTLLRLEAPTQVTTDLDKGKGLVFDFEKASEPLEPGQAENWLTKSVQSSSSVYSTATEFSNGSTGFKAGSSGLSGTKAKVFKKHNRLSQWRRKAQKLDKEISGTGFIVQERLSEDGVLTKRKASKVTEVVTKVVKRGDEKAVPNEELPMQV